MGSVASGIRSSAASIYSQYCIQCCTLECTWMCCGQAIPFPGMAFRRWGRPSYCCAKGTFRPVCVESNYPWSLVGTDFPVARLQIFLAAMAGGGAVASSGAGLLQHDDHLLGYLDSRHQC